MVGYPPIFFECIRQSVDVYAFGNISACTLTASVDR